MSGIKDYSTVQANNTSLNTISVAEGMLPSNLNNAIRALMKNTRDWYNDSQWVIYGDGSGAYTPANAQTCLLYTSPSPRDGLLSRMPSSA